MKILGYAYDADHHCVDCTLNYAREVPFAEYVWPVGTTVEDICDHSTPGVFHLPTAIDLEVIRDSEGNPIHPVFDTDEWQQDFTEPQVLACTDCGEILDTYYPGD